MLSMLSQQLWKTQQWPKDWKRSVFIPIQRKSMPKKAQNIAQLYSSQFSSVQLLSLVWLFVTSWTAARQAFFSITNSRSLFTLMSIELVMPSNHLILCHPLLLLPSIPSIRVFSDESVLCIRWPKYCCSASAVLPMNIQD